MLVCEKHGIYNIVCLACDQEAVEIRSPEFRLSKIIEAIHNEQHYKFIEKYGECFAKGLSHPHVKNINDYAVGDGDKCYSYRDEWWDQKIPFPIGVMIYLTSKIHPFSEHVRETRSGWVAPADWVASIYSIIHRKEVPKHPVFGAFYQAISNVIEQYHKDQKEKQNDTIPGAVS